MDKMRKGCLEHKKEILKFRSDYVLRFYETKRENYYVL